MPDQDAQLKLAFALDLQKLKQARQGVRELTQDAKAVELQLKTLAKTSGTTATAVGNGLKSYSQAAIQSRNETLKGTKALEAQITVLDQYKKKLAETQNAAGAGGGGFSFGKLGSTGSAVGAALSGLGVSGSGQIAQVGGQISQVINQFQQLQGALGATSVGLGSTVAAAGIAGVALIAMGLAIQKFTEDLDANKKRLDNAISTQKTYYELLATGTTESIKLGLEDLKIKLAVAQAVRRDIQNGQDQLKQFGILQGLAEQFTGLKDKAKAADDELAETQAQIDAYTRALGSSAVAANDAKKANEEYAVTLQSKAEEAQRNADQITQQIAQAQQQAAEQEANILQRAADQRVAIAKRAAQAEADALVKLQRDLASGRLQLQQRQADERLSYQREEAQSAEQHHQNLIKIRKDAEANEFELVLNRDFRGLAAARRDTDKRLQEEGERYVQERKQRLTQLKQRLQDEQRAYVREREARIKAYQQQLSDLRAQQIRDIKANDEAARIELQRLHEKLAAELKMRQTAYTTLLQQEQRYLSIREQLLAGLISRAQAERAAAGGSNSPPPVGGTGHEDDDGPGGRGGYATGGWMTVGQKGLVNEGYPGQRESFSSGGKSVMLPGGMGIFQPLKSGRVDPRGGGGGISIGDIHAYGSNPREVARIAGKLVEQKLVEAFEALTA